MCRLAQARRSQKAVVSNFLRNLTPDSSQYTTERPEMIPQRQEIKESQNHKKELRKHTKH